MQAPTTPTKSNPSILFSLRGLCRPDKHFNPRHPNVFRVAAEEIDLSLPNNISHVVVKRIFAFEHEDQGLRHAAGIGPELYDVVKDCRTGEKYLIMEYFEGQTLTEYLLDENPFPVWAIGAMCENLAVAGVLHTDLNPDNMVVMHTDLGLVVRPIDFANTKFFLDITPPAQFNLSSKMRQDVMDHLPELFSNNE